MRTMNNIEYAFVIKELAQLIGKHFENVYSVDENRLRIKIGGKDIICEPGKRIHITRYVEDSCELSGFAKNLRKELENARLKDVYQYNNDRVIVFDFNNKKLIFEMFADGNAILVEENTIVAALRNEEWTDRKIARGEQYKFPKSNIKDSVTDAIKTASEKYVIVALMQLPLGKEYALEVLSKCNIEEKKRASSLTQEEISHIQKEYEKLKSAASAYAFYEEEKIIDFGLMKFSKYKKFSQKFLGIVNENSSSNLQYNEKFQTKECKTLSEAIDEFYFIHKEEKNEKIEKLKRRLEEQEKRLVQLKQEENEKKKTGDYIYENYENIEKILKIAKETDINKLEEKLKVRVNKKEKEIEVEL